MIREFAIEPGALESDRLYDWVLDNTGIDTGQYISELPSTWVKQIYELRGHNRGTERLIEELRSKKSIVRFRKGFDWDSQANWQTNAQRLHTKKAFDVIIQLGKIEDHKEIMTPDDLRSRRDELTGTQFKEVDRTAEAMASYLESLAIVSEKLEFCAPYLTLQPNGLKFLKEIFNRCKGSKKKDVRINTRLTDTSDSHIETQVETFRKILSPLLRNSDFAESIRVIFWSEHKSGERFHDRWFLTDIGGYNIGSGFDEVPGDKNRIRRVDRDEFENVSSTFNETGNTYIKLRQFSISEDR